MKDEFIIFLRSLLNKGELIELKVRQASYMETPERFEIIRQKGVEDIRQIKESAHVISEAYRKIEHL